MELWSSKEVRRVLLPAHGHQARVGRGLRKGVWDSLKNFSNSFEKVRTAFIYWDTSLNWSLFLSFNSRELPINIFFHFSIDLCKVQWLNLEKAENGFVFPCAFQARGEQCHPQPSNLCHAKKKLHSCLFTVPSDLYQEATDTGSSGKFKV